MHFVSVLKRKADFELDFELFNPRISLSWLAKMVGNQVIARREIPEGEPECFTGNSKWLFVLKLPKTLLNSASERSLRNSGK